MRKEKLHNNGCKSRIIELQNMECLVLESAEGDRVAIGIHLEGEVARAQESCVLVAVRKQQLVQMRDYLTSVIDQVEADGGLSSPK